jgi:acid phosphatase type 7
MNMKKMKLLISCLLLAFSLVSNAQTTLVRGPYINMNTTTSVHIHWNTNVATKSLVRFGLTPSALTQVVYKNQISIHHDVQITNLLPDTKYYYAIGTNTGFMLQGDIDNYFFTSPIATPQYEMPIRIWIMGDMGKQGGNQPLVIQSFLQHVGNLPVHGFMLLGDNAYDNGLDADYQTGFFNFFQQHVTKHIPIWPCLGNHDYANDFAKRTNFQIPYFDIFSLPSQAQMGGIASNTERYYAMNYGNVHCIHLDSYGLDSVNGNVYGLADTLFSPQVAWLKLDLQANQLPWVIVSFHHPPYCMGTHNSDTENDLLSLRTNLTPLLERYNVDLVLNGHSHAYERSNLIKNHVGLASTFDSTLHIRQSTNGRYDSNSNCAYLKPAHSTMASDSGTIYAVVGSGSASPSAPSISFPHNAMSYSNITLNGSMLITIEGNRLDAKWISTDTANVVRDQFTIFKVRNRRDTIYTIMPNTLSLKANWIGAKYFWNNTLDSNRIIQAHVSHDTIIQVNDEQQCLMNEFVIIQIPASLQNVATDNLKIYPNPMTNELNIELDYEGNCEVKLIAMNGKFVQKENAFFANKKCTFSIASHLAKGTYMLNMALDNGKVITQKITKQ